MERIKRSLDEVFYWEFFSQKENYQSLLQNLISEINSPENLVLKKEILRTTIFGFGARLRKNFTNSFVDLVFEPEFYSFLDTLSMYAIEEIASTLYLAQKSWIKAGNKEENIYDTLSFICWEKFHPKPWLKNCPKPEFIYV